MTTYIAILRGINVGGHKKLPMEALRSLMEAPHFTAVRTYIQSGNIVFRSELQDNSKITALISDNIFNEFNYEVPVIVKTLAQWEQAIVKNPYKGKPIKQVLFTFLKEKPNKHIDLSGYGDTQATLQEDVVHLYCPNGYGKTKLNTNFFEKELGILATTRNWNTVEKLLQLAKKTL